MSALGKFSSAGIRKRLMVLFPEGPPDYPSSIPSQRTLERSTVAGISSTASGLHLRGSQGDLPLCLPKQSWKAILSIQVSSTPQPTGSRLSPSTCFSSTWDPTWEGQAQMMHRGQRPFTKIPPRMRSAVLKPVSSWVVGMVVRMIVDVLVGMAVFPLHSPRVLVSVWMVVRMLVDVGMGMRMGGL